LTPPSAETGEAREWFGERPWREWTAATGDWNTLRSWLTGHGFVLSAAETADVSSIRATENRRAVARGLFDASITADSHVLRIPGAQALAQLQWLPGGNASEMVGVVQSFSNIDADSVPMIGEVWYEQQFGSRLRAKVGKVDANSEFAYVDAASDFLSASMGFSPSIVAMPSYPTPASSTSVFVKPIAGIEVSGGLFNGTPDEGQWLDWGSRFGITQVAAAWTLPGTGMAGRTTAGGWTVRADDETFTPMSGLYFTAEQTLWSDAERNAAAFVQLGTSDATDGITRHVGTGLAVRGVSRRRPLDVTGVGATWARFGEAMGSSADEVLVEVFHRVVLTPSISLVPDVQLIQAPAGDASRGRTAAFTCRFRLDF
jgi:porin